MDTSYSNKQKAMYGSVEVICPCCGRMDEVKAATRAWPRCEECGEELRRVKSDDNKTPSR